MNPRKKIQTRKTSKKANQKMNTRTNNSVEVRQWERDLFDKITGRKYQKKEMEPTISIPHPEDEVTKEDLNKLVALSETSDNETITKTTDNAVYLPAFRSLIGPDTNGTIETSMRELEEKEDQYECKDCKLRFENKNNLRDHVCNTQEGEEMKGALIAKEDKLNNEPENLIVINTDEEKEINDNTFPYKCPICDKQEKNKALMQLHKENTHADQKRLPYEEWISQFISENQITNSCKDINNLKTHLKIEYKGDWIRWDLIRCTKCDSPTVCHKRPINEDCEQALKHLNCDADNEKCVKGIFHQGDIRKMERTVKKNELFENMDKVLRGIAKEAADEFVKEEENIMKRLEDEPEKHLEISKEKVSLKRCGDCGIQLTITHKKEECANILQHMLNKDETNNLRVKNEYIEEKIRYLHQMLIKDETNNLRVKNKYIEEKIRLGEKFTKIIGKYRITKEPPVKNEINKK